MAGSGSADDIIKAALKALEESRAGGKIDEVAGGAENALRDIITNLVNQAKGAAGIKPPKPPKIPKVVEPPVVPAETVLKPSQIRRAENQAAWAADKERRRLELIASGEDRASRKLRNRAEHAASQEAKYGKGKGSNRATERDNVDIPKTSKAPKAPKTPKVEEVKPTRARSANSKRLEAENDLLDMRANKSTFTKDEFAQGLSDAKNDGAKLTKKEQDIVDMYNNSKSDLALDEGVGQL